MCRYLWLWSPWPRWPWVQTRTSSRFKASWRSGEMFCFESEDCARVSGGRFPMTGPAAPPMMEVLSIWDFSRLFRNFFGMKNLDGMICSGSWST